MGLVGALSIVRYRAAIKEPEELAYIFIAIAIGLGLGANQAWITCIAFFFLCLLVVVINRRQQVIDNRDLVLNVSAQKSTGVTLQAIVDILSSSCTKVELKRFDEDQNTIDSSFAVEYETYADLETTRENLFALGDGVKIALLDNRKIY